MEEIPTEDLHQFGAKGNGGSTGRMTISDRPAEPKEPSGSKPVQTGERYNCLIAWINSPAMPWPSP
jgi:hypothetical protein